MQTWRGVAFAMVVACGGGGTQSPAELAIVDDQGMAVAAVEWNPTQLGIAMTSTVHVVNLGGQRSGTLALAITGAEIGDFTLEPATTCSGEPLEAQQQCDIVLQFLPTVVGPRNASLSVAAALGGSVEASLQGTGASGSMVQLGALTGFEAVEVGTTATANLAVTNAGDLAAAITAIAVTGALFQAGATTCIGSLAPGASCQVAITFAPTALGSASGSLAVTADGVVESLSVTGVGGGRITVAPLGSGTGSITSVPAGIDCGATCSMIATGPVVLTATSAAGSQFAGWSDPSCTGSTCTVTPAIAPTTASPTFQMLTGTVVLDPAVLDYGLVALGQSLPFTSAVTLENNTASSVDLTSITVTGAKFAAGTSTCTGPLASGASCDINIVFTPSALGTVTGSLVATVDGVDHTTLLSGTGAKDIGVQKTGTGSGTVTSSPAAIDCGATCDALSATPVTLSATPDAGSVFAGFEHCGSPCVVAPGASNVVADFELVSNFTTLDVTFAGNASGEIEVVNVATQGVLGVCSASCTVQIPRNTQVEIEATTPSAFGGFTGACTGTDPSGCSFMTALPTAITVTFTRNTHEVWTYVGAAGERAVAAAFDPNDALIVGTSTHLTKLDTTGAVVWSIPMAVTAVAVIDAGTILALSTSALVELDGAGAVLWSVPATGCAIDRPDPIGASTLHGFGRCVVAFPGGGKILLGRVVLAAATGATLYTANETAPGGFVTTNSSGVDSMGRLFIASVSTDNANNAMDVMRVAADNMSSTDLDDLGDSNGMMIVDGSDHIATATFGGTSGTLFVTDSNGTFLFEQHIDVGSLGASGIGVAGIGSSGELAFVDAPSSDASCNCSYELQHLDATGMPTWNVRSAFRFGAFGFEALPLDVAASADKIALVGTYQVATTTSLWVQVYSP